MANLRANNSLSLSWCSSRSGDEVVAHALIAMIGSIVFWGVFVVDDELLGVIGLGDSSSSSSSLLSRFR